MAKSACERCGKCCTFSIGAPFLYPADVRRWLSANQWHILRHLRLTVSKELGTQEWTFDSEPTTHRCVFLREGRCAIYKSRPVACQVYPAAGEGFTCHGGAIHEPPSKHLARRFQRAYKEWLRAPLDWRQDKARELRFEAIKRVAPGEVALKEVLREGGVIDAGET